MIICFIIGIIFLTISVGCLTVISDKSTSKLSKISFVFMMMIVIGTTLLIVPTDNSPKPIDVYRNKTTLQITYKIQGLDTLFKDTLVVWK